MTITGYSDRINHAFAFAAKHHDKAVRKGTKLPYLTHPANVAVILTRYDQDEETVTAGILHDVLEDCVRESYTREMLDERIGSKFGDTVLDTVLAVTHRKLNDDGEELSSEDQKTDYLERLRLASDRARWVCAADKIHNGRSILADLQRTEEPGTVWGRFKPGREGTVRWYRQVHDRLTELGFDAPIMQELGAVAAALEEAASTSSPRTPRESAGSPERSILP